MIKRSSAIIVQIFLLIIEEQQIKVLNRFVRNQFNDSDDFQMLPDVFQMIINNSKWATKLVKSSIISSVKLYWRGVVLNNDVIYYTELAVGYNYIDREDITVFPLIMTNISSIETLPISASINSMIQ